MSLIFDTLIWKDEDGFVPALSESWEYLPDETAYLFHLREGIAWNDKEPFSAQDVAFSDPASFTDLEALTGTGPYKLKSYDKDESRHILAFSQTRFIIAKVLNDSPIHYADSKKYKYNMDISTKSVKDDLNG